MGWRSQQYGSFERFLVALSRRSESLGMATHLVFNEPVASEAFVSDVHADVHVARSPANPLDPRFAAGLGRLLRRIRPTYLHVHFGTDAYHTLAVASAAGVPRRFATKRIVPAPSYVSGLRHRWLASRVERFFTVSARVKRALEALGVPSSKLEVCYHGVDPDAYRPDPDARRRTREALGISEDARVVLSTSHLRPGKGVEVLPTLAAELSERPGGVVVLAAGGGPLVEELRGEAGRLGLADDTLRFLGVREDIPDLLAAADLHLFPTSGTEGLGSSPIEALAAGVPVVATAVSDMEELISDVAKVVPPGDHEAIIAACQEVLEADRAELGRRGRELVAERLNVHRAAQQHIEAYGLEAG
jgi:glycosyltransferase involved in cell wall biosynthesis